MSAESTVLSSTAMSDRTVSPGTHRAHRGRDGVTPLGEQLRAARERRGDVLEQVSEATRIRTHYLEALERHDWKALPADVFTRGYLRTYAQYLGLDQEHMLRAYVRERRLAGVDGPSTHGRDEPDAARAFLERLAETKGIRVRRFGTKLKWIALGLSGAGIGALAVWAFLHLLWPIWSAPTAVEAPPRAELPSASAPPTAGAETSPASHPLEVVTTPEPVPAPPSEPRPAEPPSASHLQVQEFGVGTDVRHHRLVGRGDRFRDGSTVWFWTSVLGGRRGDRIRHVWLHEGRTIAEADLPLKGAQWRTQSRRWLPKGSTGDWTVEARDSEGLVIATADFTCVP